MPHILAWLQRLVGMLKVKDPKAIGSLNHALSLSSMEQRRSPRAIALETAWRIIKAIARENEFPRKVGTQSTRKTLARKVYTWSNDIRVVQGILGQGS
jgi:site-specific recombinase XerC